MVDIGEKANCAGCRKRPVDQGGSGACPQIGTLGDIFRKRGQGNGCTKFVEGDFVSKRVTRELELHPQEAALF